MTSLTSTKISARKRREVAETARLRMAALLPAAEGPVGAEETTTTGPPAGGSAESSIEALSEQPPGSPAASSSGPSSELPFGVLPGGPAGEVAGGAVAAGAVAEGGPDDDAPDRVPFRLGPAVMLDRRAVVGLAVLLLLAVGYGVQHFWLARPQPVDVPAMAVASAEPGARVPGRAEATPGPAPPGAGGPDASTVVVVDIGGRVHSPGVHSLPGGSRVADALRVAGGPLPETETKNLNLARVLTDGEQILVGESAAPPAGGAGAGPPAPAGPKQPVSLNHATLEQLDTLPGVGPTLAQRIIAFRAAHGSFRSLDQLRQVSGIGERTYAEIRPMLTL
ncbi:ComEA family DNA-binding protein [Kitasatospora sp. NBC_00085]|uniref:helix-hairpin-helix domain-containing protein n=1 Tax=unclassified Kitasatospora TaxID=2633591 RepID=UPI0032448911